MLTGKKVIVMGGTSGIGLATAKDAAEQGATVIIVSSSQARIDQALKTLPGSPEGYAVDLSKERNIQAFFQGLGKFDHLVYTAGENISLIPIDTMDLGPAREFWNIRYWGAVAAVKYGHAQVRPGGSISLIGGTANHRPGKGWSLGASLTAAMEGFTLAMAVELAPIRVNLAAPGIIRTNLWNSFSEADRNAIYAAEAQRLPAGRVGEAEDIASTFLFFMNNPHITGQVVVVDGGSVLV